MRDSNEAQSNHGQLLLWRLGLGELMLNVRRKRFDPFEVGSSFPQFIVRVPLAVGEHPRKPDTVLGDPKDLCFGVSCSGFRKLRNERIQAVAGCIRLSWRPMATGASIEIDLAARDKIFVGGRNRVGYLWRATTHGSVNSGKHQRLFPSRRRKIGANFRESETQVSETSHKQQKHRKQDAA